MARKVAKKNQKQYAAAGVDIALGDAVKGKLKESLKRASRPEVLGGIGGFGGLFQLDAKKFREPVLVSSTDGVGTKLELAFASGKHAGIGEDIVHHCLDDIAVTGAEPLFFLDYFAAGKLDPKVFQGVLGGMANACEAAHCALIGGETAQMPGFYRDGTYDLCGTIVGVVEKSRILTGQAAKPGDVLVGVASNGLHTNGYTLARDITFNRAELRLDDNLPGTKTKVSTALLKPHTNYANLLQAITGKLNAGTRLGQRTDNGLFGAAHITGGGLPGNLPRVLPENCDAVIETSAWKVPPLFRFLVEAGKVSFEERYEVFNMGVGLVLVVDPSVVDDVLALCQDHKLKAWPIGELVAGSGRVTLQG